MSVSPAPPLMSVPSLVVNEPPAASSPAPPEDQRPATTPSGHSSNGGASSAASASLSPPTPISPVKNEPEQPVDEDEDELDDEPMPPSHPTPSPMAAPASATTTPAVAAAAASSTAPAPSPKASNSGGGGGSKSRKSSCDLCHHRKIKCDQVRPSCSSCMRKGHPCHYSEETEANNSNRRASDKVNGGGSSEARPPTSQPRPFASNGTSPAWMSASRSKSAVPNGGGGGANSRPASAAGGSADRKRRLDRDRIVNGYGSSSDEGEGDAEGSVRPKGRTNGASAPSAGAGAASSAAVAAALPSHGGIDNDLADMLGDSKDDEVDELIDSGDEGTSSRGKKRDASVDDELSGELLELASAPPKKKKARAPAAETSNRPSSSRPRAHAAARQSLPATLHHSTLSSTAGMPPTYAGRYDAYNVPLVTLMQSLPSNETQNILFNTFFSDPFLTEGISLLQPQFVEDFHSLVERRSGQKLREGDATTLANAFAFLAVALRVLPEETGKLLLASGSSAASSAPRSAGRIIANQLGSANDPTPLDQRYFELALLAAQIAEQRDAPSVMYVVHKLVLFRYATLGFRKDKVVLAGGWLAQAIKTAQALGMSKEWEGIPQGERELRRRVMWSLYVADRQFAFETAFPYTILDTHQGIHLPSPISEADLYKIAPDSPTLPPHSTEAGPTACTALFIHTHLSRRITPILDSFATVGPSGTPHDLVLRFDASLDDFQNALPPYLRLFPLTDTRFDSQHPYLAPHRVRLHSTLLSYRLGVHRAHLASYLDPHAVAAVRAVIAQVCLGSLRCQKSAKMLDPKISPRLFNPATVFEAAATLALIMYVERAVAGPKGANQMAVSSEYLAMRAGVADGLELLDSLGSSSDNAAYARGAVRVLREVISKVDAGPRGSLSPSPNGGADDSMGNGSSTSPPTKDAHNPYLASVSAWLDVWRATGINVDYILREADWTSWEKIIAPM